MANKKQTKLTKAVHIKRRTEGTSNEISISVLDAARDRADIGVGSDSKNQIPRLGGIHLFSWQPYKNKSTPTRDDASALTEIAHISSQGPISLSSIGGSFSGGSIDYIEPADYPMPVESSKKQAPIASIASLATGSNIDISLKPEISTNARPRAVAKTDTSAGLIGSPLIEAEIERRKSRRKTDRIFTTILGVIFLLAGFVGGGFLLYKEISTQHTQATLLDQGLNKIVETDEVIVKQLDPAINGSFGSQSAEDLQAIYNNIPGTEKLLSEAEVFINDALIDMKDSEDKEAAAQALIVIEARKGMLEAGKTLLPANIQVVYDYGQINATWKKVLEADEIAREAAEIVTETTPENVAISISKTNEAILALNEAESSLYTLFESFLSPDIQLFVDYLAKRKEALGYAIASDEAILAQERLAAEEQNTAYNIADAEAVALAKELPPEVSEIVTSAYNSYTEEAHSQYAEMRAKGSSADAVLRDYLGIRTK